jgi:peptidoglycan-associated lipoprotein
MGLGKRCPSAEFKAGLKVCYEHDKGRLLSAVILLTVGLYACGTKKVVSNAPPPPPPPAPVATIDVSPSTVQAGQTTLITWETQNATEVRVEPLGVVEANGSKEVSPTDSTTYRLFAKGPGGVQGASIRVTVTTAAVSALSAEEDLLASRGGRQDIFFDTDAFSIRLDQEATVRDDVEFLKQHPDLNIAIEGHCDELGSTEYNLALGASRASEFKSELVNAGVDGKRIETVSYGKERPFCSESNEDCWKQNRRAHVVAVNHR